ncbi:MAG TPA: hypothetical protein VN238_14000 [Solirubrobacteraceae bacterium]|nr:hypothetical protein [Solirubrobacteraceae bacterium]
MPARTASLLTLVLVVAALIAPAGALAQSSPFGPIPQAPPEPVPTVAPANSNDDDGLTRTQEILIGLAGFALLGGIAWAIVRDARANAPVADPRRDPVLAGGLDDEETSRRSGSRTPKQQRVKSNRQKAKAARQARKRNARRR